MITLDYIQTKVLGFCNCGEPEENIAFLGKILKDIDTLSTVKWEDYEEWNKKSLELFGNEQSRYFIWYYLHKEGFTEHGGSVPGWLTDKGKELLKDIESCLEN